MELDGLDREMRARLGDSVYPALEAARRHTALSASLAVQRLQQAA